MVKMRRYATANGNSSEFLLSIYFIWGFFVKLFLKIFPLSAEQRSLK